MRLPFLFCCVVLVACQGQPVAEVTKSHGIDDQSGLSTLAMAPATGLPARRGNAEMAADFLDLEFQMESGKRLPVLTRFSGPITYGLSGEVPASARRDVAALVARLRSEAGLDLRAVPDGAPAALTIEFSAKSTLSRLEPSAACFVVPNVSSLREYRSQIGSSALDWGLMTRRDRAAIFIPSDTSPQEIRDCLHEEMAQALGPVNDLYRLPDSVFNDDNFQSTLTGFDMLMLRLHYAPQLQSGMTEAEVAARLPDLIAALNPAGAGVGTVTGGPTPRVWLDAVNRALGPHAPDAARLQAARQMVAIAEAEGWQDNRLGFAYFVLGRLLSKQDVAAAWQAYDAAGRIYAGLADGGVHLSHVQMQLAALALGSHQPEAAISFVDSALPVAQRFQNASQLTILMLIKAEALAQLGRDTEARALRLDSASYARYGIGTEPDIRARAQEIAALAARGTGG